MSTRLFRPGLVSGLVIVLAGTLLVSACSGGKVKTLRKNRASEIGKHYEEDEPRETIFGEGGLTFGGGPKSLGGADTGGGIGVNSYLWRASLDTIAFMPVTSADPFGGVIITDWYSPPETPNERFKINLYILGKTMRADGIRVSVFRQALDSNGNWRDVPVEADAARKVEDAVLTRARQLRAANRTG